MVFYKEGSLPRRYEKTFFLARFGNLVNYTRIGFDVLNIQSVPGLAQANYADEMHVNASGVPIYTHYLVSRLKR